MATDRSATPARRGPSRARKTLFIAIIIAVNLLLIEGLSFVLLAARDRPRDVTDGPHLLAMYRSHELNPDYRYRLPDGSTVNLHSPDGFREAEPVSLEPASDTYRIIALGGSTLYGIAADHPYPDHPALLNDQTIDYALERILNEKLAGSGRRVEVINAGVTAYWTFQHLIHLNERLLDYRPHALVFLDGHNDYYNAFESYRHWLDYGYGEWLTIENVNEPSAGFAAHVTAKSLGRVSHFGYLLHYVSNAYWSAKRSERVNAAKASPMIPLDRLEAEYPALARRSFIRVYRQVAAIGQFEGIEVDVFLQPEILLEAPETLSLADRKIYEITMTDPRGSLEMMRRIHPMIAPLFDDVPVDFHDLGTISTGQQSGQLYTDYCHLTPAGAVAVAERMSEALLPDVLSWAEASPGRQPSGEEPGPAPSAE